MSLPGRLTLLFLAFVAGACSSAGPGSGPDYYDAEPATKQASATSSASYGLAGLEQGDTSGLFGRQADPGLIADFDVEAGGDAPPAPISARRLLVYSGRFEVAVGEVEQALDAARVMAEQLGGYFQSLSDQTITIRVPAGRWEEALARVAAIGRVLSRQIDAADVTEEVVDLKLRLRNALALGERLEELLKLAKSVEEALAVEKELNRIRTEIERLEGRLQLLSDRIAFSTLVIRFTPAANAPNRPQALPFPWLQDLGLNHLLGLSGGVR